MLAAYHREIFLAQQLKQETSGDFKMPAFWVMLLAGSFRRTSTWVGVMSIVLHTTCLMAT